mmetsp:Transcript_6875/g.14432  ORF Transcript_6875/g.14432 Transcript_6875/m.14432 type:complete len:234 (+) Transcript_6875:48-749(+)
MSFWECPKCDFVNRSTDAGCKACGGPCPSQVGGGGSSGGGGPAPTSSVPYQPYQQSAAPPPAASAPSMYYSAPVAAAPSAPSAPSPPVYTTQPVYATSAPANQGVYATMAAGATANRPAPNAYASASAGSYHPSAATSHSSYGGGHGHGGGGYHGKDAKYRRDFDRIDRDHSGYIDGHDLNKLLKGAIPDSQISKILKLADKDKDGRVSFEEYKKIMKKVEMAQKLLGKKLMK